MSSNDLSNKNRKKQSKRRRKSRFHGNQFSKKTQPDEPNTGRITTETAIEQDQDTDEEPYAEEPVGPSQKKLKMGDEFVPTHSDAGFRIFDMGIMQSLISQACLCRRCKIGKMILEDDPTKKMGMATFLSLKCDFCKAAVETYSSSRCEGTKAFEVNRRSVLAMLETGGGITSLQKICGLLNMPSPMTIETYAENLRCLKGALEEEAQRSMKKAADEEHIAAGVELDETLECNAMFDGTWRKRGFSSLQGGVTAISAVSGKCLDYETLNKSCPGCSRWQSKPDTEEKQKWLAAHKCSINFTGSAPAMEPEGVKRIFSRSETNNNLQYTGYIGDGDSKSFSMMKASKPYDNKEIKKLECVGHVQKRMGTALRKIKSTHGAKKLDDGKSIGGQGRLTADRIDKLQVYFGLAIRRHKNDLDGMKSEVWAGLYHSASTDEKPQHQFCPDSADTWCKFRKAEKEGREHHHKKALPEAVMKAIKPAYDRLTNLGVLEGCLGGYTQNNCEALNHLIWSRCPKTRYSGRDHLDSAAAGAVIAFNDGVSALGKVLANLGIKPGHFTMMALKTIDKKRVRESNMHASNIRKKIRQSKRKSKKALEDKQSTAEGATYASGAF